MKIKVTVMLQEITLFLLQFYIKIKTVKSDQGKVELNYEFMEFTENVFDEPVYVRCKGKVLQVTD